MKYMAKALNEAAKLARELEKASGRTFTVGSESSENSSIDIFEVLPHKNYKHVFRVTGSTWKDVYSSVQSTMTMIYLYQMIQKPTNCGSDA